MEVIKTVSTARQAKVDITFRAHHSYNSSLAVPAVVSFICKRWPVWHEVFAYSFAGSRNYRTTLPSWILIFIDREVLWTPDRSLNDKCFVLPHKWLRHLAYKFQKRQLFFLRYAHLPTVTPIHKPSIHLTYIFRVIKSAIDANRVPAIQYNMYFGILTTPINICIPRSCSISWKVVLMLLPVFWTL